MDFPKPYTLGELSSILAIAVPNQPNFVATGLNEYHQVRKGDVMFVDHPKYYGKAFESEASVIIMDQAVQAVPEGKAVIVHSKPFKLFNQLITHFLSLSEGKEAIIGSGSRIHPSAFLGKDVVIGDDCNIAPGAIICDRTTIGNRVTVGPGSVVGHDAFYYKKRPEGYDKLITCGRVVLHDDVEIGAKVTVDAGVTGDTILGEGTKVDNQVHIGHDVTIGKRCLFAAQVGIAGCVIIEDDVTLWGQVGVPSDRRIGKGAMVLGQSGVLEDIPAGKTFFGSPASDAREHWRELAAIKRLPELLRQLNKK